MLGLNAGDVCYSGKDFMRRLIRPTIVATGEVISSLSSNPLGLGSTEHGKSQKEGQGVRKRPPVSRQRSPPKVDELTYLDYQHWR